MPELFDADFYEVSVPVIRRIEGPIPFDVYVRRAPDTYTKIFPRDEVIDEKRFQNYELAKGVEFFYVTKEDYRTYLLYVERVIDSYFQRRDQNLTIEELTYLIKDMSNLTMLEVSTQTDVDQELVSHATSAVRGCMDVLNQDPKKMIQLFKLLLSHPYQIRHAVTTAVFALMLAKKLKLESAKTMSVIGLGAFFHDIGMSRLAFDAEEKTELSSEEWKELKEHPQIGKRLLDSVKGIGREVRDIVFQHHEQPNGMGYPNGLHLNEIFLPSKIVAIADSFSALMSRRPYRESPSDPQHALALMTEEKGKFDPQLLTVFSQMFVKLKT